jgi:hypothetical protein
LQYQVNIQRVEESVPSLRGDCLDKSFLSGINGAALPVPSETLEADDSVNLGEQCVIAAAADIDARMDLRAALTVKDVAREHKLTIGPLRPKTLGLGISSVFS